MGGFFSSPKRTVQIVSVETTATGSVSHVTFDVRRDGSFSSIFYPIAAKRVKRTFPTFFKEFLEHMSDAVFLPSPRLTPADHTPLPPSEAHTSAGARPKPSFFNLSPFEHLTDALLTLQLLKGDPPSILKTDMISLLLAATGETTLTPTMARQAAKSADESLASCSDSHQRMTQLHADAGARGVSLREAAMAIRAVMLKVRGFTSSQVHDISNDSADSNSTSSSYSEEDQDDHSPQRHPRITSTGKKSRRPPSHSDAVEPGANPRSTGFPPSAMDHITPPASSPLDAARIFFSNAVIRSASSLDEEVPQSVSPEEAPALACRYGFALQRLISRIGDSWLPSSPPHSLAELRMLRKVVINSLSSRSKESHFSSSSRAPKAKRQKHSTSSSDSDEPDDSLARHIARSPEAQVGAISSEVARRLNKRASEIHFEPNQRVRDGISNYPSDLSRASYWI